MFNQQLLDALTKKYGQAKALMPMIPGAGLTNQIAGTLTEKLAPMIASGADDMGEKDPSASPALPPTPPSTPPAMPTAAPTPAPTAPALPSMPAIQPPATPAAAPVMPSLNPQYNDAARQQLYSQLAAKQKEGGAYAAAAGLGDMARRMGGSTGVDAQQNIQNQLNTQDKTARSQFEAGRQANVEDISTGLALKKAGREETEYTEQNDPNSPMSKLAVGFLQRMGGAEKMGVTPGKTTYADSVKIMPMVEKYVAMETLKAEKAKKEGDSLYQKKLQQLESVRGDQPLKNTEVQRDAAGTAYRSLAEAKARTGSYSQNPVDYIDTLGQLYKARTGQAPTDQVFKHLVQDWTGGNIAKVATFLTGQQLNTSSNDVGASILEMVNRMGDQADLQHEGYMKTRVDDRGLSPEDADAFHKLAKRGYTFAEQKQMIDDALTQGRSTVAPQTASAAAHKQLGGGWTVRH